MRHRSRICLSLSLLSLTFLTIEANGWSADEAPPSRKIAITIDDLPLNGPPLSLKQTQEMTKKLTGKLQANHIPAIGFVNEHKLYVKIGEVDARIALLQMWLDRGLDLGNHTFSHFSLQTTPLADDETDLIRGETVTAKLLAARGEKLTYFRYPYLQTGPTAEIKKGFQQFLSDHHYINAPITIDADDWMFAAVYTKAKLRGDKKTMQRIVDAYLEYNTTMFDYFEKMTLDVVGHPITQIMLMHDNSLNADHLDELVKLMRGRGYEFVPLAEALKDPAYQLPDDFVGEDGISWLKRWRFTQGKPLSMGKEPEPPQFIQDLYKDAQYED